jgi:Elongation factor Tu GTP binding domain
MSSSFKASDLIARDIDAYLHEHRHKSLLRFITCGSVDDGKSTLIGRLLYDSKMIFEDQLASLEADSKRMGTQGQEIDFALLVDGLARVTLRRRHRFPIRQVQRTTVPPVAGLSISTRPPSARAR